MFGANFSINIGTTIKILCCIALICLSSPAYPQIHITRNGKALSRIVLSDNEENSKQAAMLLQDFVKRISGTELPIEQTERHRKGDIVIGGRTDLAGEDGFTISTRDGQLHIQSGGDKGAVYGIVTLLEDYLNVRYYAKDTYTLDKTASITVPEINRSETPAFRYRQTYSYGNEDPVYKMWFRLEEPNGTFVPRMWVHTFGRILPAGRFGKEHPEYYSLIDGKRIVGEHSQWCLTNPDVLEAAVCQIDSIFKANPGVNLISVSQNDGNNSFCQCDSCRKVNEYEGSPSGSIIRFLNELARRFPDKEFSTLAYTYSVQPPRHTRPLPNVNIMLCNIGCTREVPLTDNVSGQKFMKALKGWADVSDNIFVWDYGINFHNYLSPFPNFHILQKNMQLFKEHNVTMHFPQVNGYKGADFAEMRAYMLGKLMWNPYSDADSLMRSFMDGYYGKAARYLYQYQKIMQGALIASHKPLYIYETPISYKDGMLSPLMLKTYNELFDKAEAAVKDNPAYLEHVRLSRLPLIFAELEIARTDPEYDRKTAGYKLELFHKLAEELEVKSLNERGNTSEDYYAQYKERFLSANRINIAAGAQVEWILPPTGEYKEQEGAMLTDGLLGGTNIPGRWIGWKGVDAGFIIDLGTEKEFSQIEADFIHLPGRWVFLPKGGKFSVSSDKKEYRDFGSFKFEEDRQRRAKFAAGKVAADTPVKARYIKVDVETIGLCPSWHFGVGLPAWFLMDEVIVQ